MRKKLCVTMSALRGNEVCAALRHGTQRVPNGVADKHRGSESSMCVTMNAERGNDQNCRNQKGFTAEDAKDAEETLNALPLRPSRP